MKKLKLILTLLLGMFFMFSSCKKENSFLPKENIPKPENQTEPDNEIILGDKLENAYSVKNMRQAYNNLKQKSKIKYDIDIKTTHLYVRFLPENLNDLSILQNDTTLELFDYPLDYRIIKEGLYYHDPAIPKEKPTWQYTVVPVNYVFPDIKYEIIEKCFIPKEHGKNKSTDYYNELEDIVFESMKLTNNLTEEEKKELLQNNQKRPSKEYPKGYIEVYNTNPLPGHQNLEGVKRIKVRVYRGVKISSTYTDASGYYSISTGYRYNVHYSIIFKNSTGFKIWGNRAFLAPACYNMGKHSKTGYTKYIYTNSVAWLWSTVNNGTYIYREFLCPAYGINKPPANIRLWSLRMGGNNLGSAPMARQISLNASTFKNYLIALGVLQQTAYIINVMPDIFIVKDFKNTKYAYGTIFHELSHASHYTKAGKPYWINYINGIILNGGNYGDGTGRLDGYIGVGEMWGNYFGYICEKRYFDNVWLGGTHDWFKPQILKRVDDEISGMTPNKLFYCLQSTVTNHQKLKNKLISYYGNSSKINQIFSHYGF